MTELEHRLGSGGAKDNVRDELAEAAGQGRGGEPPARRPPPRRRGRLAPEGSRTTSGTSCPSRKSVA